MVEAVRRGVSVELLVHDTERRVPSKLVDQLASSGIRIVRVTHPDELPMHAKFLLVEEGQKRIAWLGSYNFNKNSRRYNAEVLVRTVDPVVFRSLEQRFDVICAMS